MFPVINVLYGNIGKSYDCVHRSPDIMGHIEKSANDNIALAKEALEFVYSLEAKLVCTLSKGTDLKNEIFLIYKAAQPLGIKIQFTAGSLLNYVATCCPEKLYEDMIKEDIHVYLNNTGIIYVY